MVSTSQAPPPAGRPPRTFRGLVAALVVCLVFVAAYVAFRGVFRDQPDVGPTAVDYKESVAAAQQAGVTLVYPRSLPSGWLATSIDFQRGTRPAWGLGILTDAGTFVGLRQEDADVRDLLATYVDASPDAGPDASPPGDVATRWSTWSDTGGDLAWSTDLRLDGGNRDTLLVYGSASKSDQEELIGLLTTDPVASGSSS